MLFLSKDEPRAWQSRGSWVESHRLTTPRSPGRWFHHRRASRLTFVPAKPPRTPREVHATTRRPVISPQLSRTTRRPSSIASVAARRSPGYVCAEALIMQHGSHCLYHDRAFELPHSCLQRGSVRATMPNRYGRGPVGSRRPEPWRHPRRVSRSDTGAVGRGDSMSMRWASKLSPRRPSQESSADPAGTGAGMRSDMSGSMESHRASVSCHSHLVGDPW